MFERFTERARKVVVLAQEQGGRLGHDYIGTEHLLSSLLREGDGVNVSGVPEPADPPNPTFSMSATFRR